ncbi:DMT family transporter [Agrobacterium sp. ES01]|uniref:DMT family transporter n=1 Tax=Agrobacterium sp. ES01 TaxID=3420714 RepID=UPI003D14AE1F
MASEMATTPKGDDDGRSAAMMAAFAGLVTILIWSGNTIVTKASADVIAPASIAFYRWLIAFIVLTPFVAKAVWRDRRLALGHWHRLFLLAMLGMVTYQSLAYEAAKTTTAVNMGVLVALMPLIAAFAAAAIAGERLTPARLLGAAVSLFGVAYLISHGDPAVILRDGFRIGDALMIVAVAANAFYGVFLRRWPMPFSLWQQLWWQIGFSTLVLLPLWLLSDISALNAQNLPLVLYAALPTSLIAPYCWIFAVRGLGAARTTLFLNLLPPIVAGLAALLLGEQLQLFHLIGGGLAIAGVLIGMRRAPVRVEPLR